MFIIFIAVVSLISPVLKYIYFTFHIEENELIIQKGLLQKERKSIPLERIQSININQNVVQRILGIVSLEVETAGSKAKELEIPGLDKVFASQFKELLQERKEEITEEINLEEVEETSASDESQTVTTETVNAAATKKRTTAPETVILKLGFLDILKVGITQNHLKSGGLAIGVAFGGWYQVNDILQGFFSDYMEEFSWENIISSASAGIAVSFLILFLFFSVIISMVLAFNKYWDFSIVKKGDDLEVKMGLLNKKEVKIPLSKVQVLEFHSNPLRKLLGFKTAHIYQAQSTDSKLGSVSVPAYKKEHRIMLQNLIFEDSIEATEQELHCNPYSYARLRFYIASTIIFPIMAVAYYFEQYVAIVPLIIVLILLVLAAYMYGKSSKVIKDDDFVVFKKGWIFPQTIISPVFKTQAVEKWRSVFLKRRREAHFKLHTAGGTRGLRYFKEDQLDHLINTVNNQVIFSEKKWM
ncbi:YdbT [Nonlabens dokdonensis DSW-6]|uniref:YdbT n=2 Tax=Nonlabens dokdonensis TaxID=328515 RepID=L7WG33_NONDD|nr:YdbT [Nonlabens dokdonensis DSW-6]